MLDMNVRARVSLRLLELWASSEAMVVLVEVRGEGHHGDRNMVANEIFAGRDKRGTPLGPYCRTCRVFFFCDYLSDILTRPAVRPDPYQSNPEQTNERLRKEPIMSTGFTN